MNFISRLYFNTFKRKGNLHLMIVVSCLCACISLLLVGTTAAKKVYLYRIDSETLSPDWDIPVRLTWTDMERIRDLQILLPVLDLCRNRGNEAAFEYINQSHVQRVYVDKQKCIEYQRVLDTIDNCENRDVKIYPNAPWNKETSIKDVEQICAKVSNGQSIHFWVYSFSYLWNLLWVFFWFYFPFLLVMPIKFIFDGYKQDENK